MSTAEEVLTDALRTNAPLRDDVRRALIRVLNTLGLSDDAPYSLVAQPDATAEDRCDADLHKAAAWRLAVKHYQALLTEVRENGVSELTVGTEASHV
jgi:hypothetical protein